MKWWYAVCAALLLFLPPHATAADDLNGAARELARKTAAFVGRGETVSVAWRNLSSLSSPELNLARAVFEAGVRDAGARAVEAASGDAAITLSENATQYLLVEEIRKGDDRQVWIAAWNRAGAARVTGTSVTLETKLLWQQDDPILDVAFSGELMLVLSPSKVAWFNRQNGQWTPRSKVDLPALRWPRDVRGRLRNMGQAPGAGLQAFLPGMTCRVMVQPPALECRPGEEPWVLESGTRSLLVANFAASRNYFDGRVTTQTGARKVVPPFYSAAAVEENGRPLWLLALIDGRTQIFDPAFEPAAVIPSWGSDIAGVEARCGGGFPVLATRPSDARDSDAIQAFGIVNRAAVALAPPAELPGPVTALWPSGGASAVTVVHDLQTGKYVAYLITVVCGA